MKPFEWLENPECQGTLTSKAPKLADIPFPDYQKFVREAFTAKPSDKPMTGFYPTMCDCGEFILWPLDAESQMCSKCNKIWKMVGGAPIQILKRRMEQHLVGKAVEIQNARVAPLEPCDQWTSEMRRKSLEERAARNLRWWGFVLRLATFGLVLLLVGFALRGVR